MARDWVTEPLGELVEMILDKRGVTAKKLGSRFRPSGRHLVISAKAVKNGRVDLSAAGPRYVDAETFDRWMGTCLEADDVLLTSEAPLGESAYIAESQDWCLGQRLFGIRTKKNRLHGRYLFYAFQSPHVRSKLYSRSTGTTAQGIRQSELRKLRLTVPSCVSEQKAVARLLGCLDDKIELNRRRGETLETTVRLLFKSWFLGRGVARFASTREEDLLALGRMRGWDIEPLEVHVVVTRGLSYSGKGLRDDGIPLHNLNSVREGGGYKPTGLKFYAGKYRQRHLVRAGDLIVANTEQGHDRLLIGYAAIIPGTFGEEAIASHHLYVLRPRSTSYLTPEFLCFLLNTMQMQGVVSGFANGTTVNMLPVDALQMPKFLVPPESLVREFTEFARAVRRRRENLQKESATLEKLRDTLLPRLISGELRIEDPETFLERTIG